MTDIVAELRGVTMRYAGVTALDDVSIRLRAGEVHALAGENGAGKSTLVKIIGGAVVPDAGTILIEGEPRRLRGPHDAIDHGIAVVHQELIAAPDLSVTENILLGRLPRRLIGVVDWSGARREAREALAGLGVSVSERAPMRTLSLGQQQLVEIARALQREVKVLVLDEPSAILGRRELGVLFDVVRSLRRRGVAVVYISHRIGEILDLSDRVTILRDGRGQGTFSTPELTEQVLIDRMTGRKLTAPARPPAPAERTTLLRVDDLEVDGSAQPVSFTVGEGEIVGLAGLVGSGRTELARGIVGADHARGSVLIRERRIRPLTLRNARRHGVAYLPEDRKGAGLLLNRSVRENVGLASLAHRSRLGVLRSSADARSVRELAAQVRLKAAGIGQLAVDLSGGNQQKVMIARWLAAAPDVLILDEPTRGIDVGGKSEIYGLMRTLADSGKGIVLISSEVEEILAMSDRVLVMRSRQLVAQFAGSDITEENIARAAIADTPSREATTP